MVVRVTLLSFNVLVCLDSDCLRVVVWHVVVVVFLVLCFLCVCLSVCFFLMRARFACDVLYVVVWFVYVCVSCCVCACMFV